jgi:translation initiation factor 2B subunit (eIF-2B alpha/beta/delta family)
VKRVSEALAGAASPWISRAVRVVSISRSSAVAAAVEGAWRTGWRGSVVVLDGSSAGRGAEQVERLGRLGPAVSQPDAAAPRWLDLDGTLVAVGADAVGGRHFINCVGTSALLELAAARGRSTILIADRGKDVPERTLETIVEALPLHREGPGREWPLFETISLALVTERISD